MFLLESSNNWGGWGYDDSVPGGHQNSPYRGWDCTILYMLGKLAPNSTHFTRGLVEYAPGRGYFRAAPSQNGENFASSSPPPFVELARLL